MDALTVQFLDASVKKTIHRVYLRVSQPPLSPLEEAVEAGVEEEVVVLMIRRST
tara:strand:+ start:237 stop:398 length:162 start_codon:yes stop_codon:yes gene_type:complete